MMRRALVIGLMVGSGMLVGCAPKGASFGEPLKMSHMQTVPIERVFADMEQYEGKTVRVAGYVADVCKHKGCWLKMADKEKSQTMFVKFTCPVEGHLVPMDAMDHRVIVEGEVIMEEISEDEARHYAEDGGQSAEEIAKIVGPQKRVRMKSPGAMIVGLKQS